MSKKEEIDKIVAEAIDLYNESEDTPSEIAAYLWHKNYELLSIAYANDDSFRRSIARRIANKIADREIISENVKLQKGKQRAQDLNRIERKAFRGHARIENAISEYAKEYNAILKKQASTLKKFKLKPLKKVKPSSSVGVLQITDIHANEIIDLPHNKYDFKVLAARLKQYVNDSLEYFEFHNVDRVWLFFTGDLLNSDRRLDEMLSQASNRAKATYLTEIILTQAIMEIRERGFKVDIVSVLGNESRAKKEMSFTSEAFSDNYDFTIVSHMKHLFEYAPIQGITFHSIDKLEEVVCVGGQNWLLIHNLSKALDNQKNAQSAIGKYSLKGVNIDFIIGGHIHATRITDISARSSSMSGSNEYNENALNLMGRASHNCYVVKDGRRFTQVIDLQDVDVDKGYLIESHLEAYNAKSSQKAQGDGDTIIRIII